VLHFIVDLVIAIPLILFPEAALSLLGWKTIDPFTSRIAGAALMGIGIESLLARNAGSKVYRAMLNLKIIWSLTAIFGIVITMVNNGPQMGWVFLGLFTLFCFVWIYYRFRGLVRGIL
jgi:threonine/homoserine/homoserine lactone efflux protein